jgi:hypothetical protein
VASAAWLAGVLLAASPAAGLAADQLEGLTFELEVEDVEGDDWGAQGIALELGTPRAGRLAALFEVAGVDLPNGHGRLEGLRLACADARAEDGAWRCDAGRLYIAGSPVGAQDAQWRGDYAADGTWKLAIPALDLARGRVALSLSGRPGHWSAQIEPSAVTLAPLAALTAYGERLRDWSLDGRVSGRFALEGEAAELRRVQGELRLDRLGYASADGTQAAEAVQARLRLDARRRPGAWSVDGRLAWSGGGLYSAPLFIDAGATPLAAELNGSWRPEHGLLELERWTLDLADVLALSGHGSFNLAEPAVAALTLNARSEDLGPLYERLLQPFLVGTPADELDAGGRFALELRLDHEGAERFALEFTGLGLEDRQGRFAIASTGGSIAWARDREVPVSTLDVQGASLYRIPLGPFAVRAQFAGDRVALTAPVELPALGGRVVVDSLALEGAMRAGAAPSWTASATLHDLSLDELTAALEWPAFSGSVNARLRDVRYAEQRLEVGGGIEVQAFDGSLRVERLSIEDPLGTVPILEAEASFTGLDLDALTSTFAFGRIEGRLDGRLQDLRLVAWEPDRFELHLYTPDGDSSRRRISQRAVENLTELGSGVPAGLSSTVLQVFDEFRYRRIELHVLLDGDRAELDGLAREEGGYYLVQGSGLPRIDVIGRNRSVAWKDLLERLAQIRVEGAEIR